MDLKRFPLPDAPLSMSSRQIFGLGWGETRRCKINLKEEHNANLDWFRPSQGVTALLPVSLYYVVDCFVRWFVGCLVAFFLCALDTLRAATFIVRRTALEI
jgi:hypothetical protein